MADRALIARRSFQCSFNGPTAFQPGADKSGVNGEDYRPLAQAFLHTVKCEDSVRALIPSLLNAGCPPTVARLVVSAVVDSVDGVLSARTWSHIKHEVFKTEPPAFTYYDAPSAVGVMPLSVGVRATLFHSTPDGVTIGPRFPLSGRPVTDVVGLTPQASTAHRTEPCPSLPNDVRRNAERATAPLADSINRHALTSEAL